MEGGVWVWSLMDPVDGQGARALTERPKVRPRLKVVAVAGRFTRRACATGN